MFCSSYLMTNERRTSRHLFYFFHYRECAGREAAVPSDSRAEVERWDRRVKKG